jgi:hypothetical protein
MHLSLGAIPLQYHVASPPAVTIEEIKKYVQLFATATLKAVSMVRKSPN